MWFAMDIYYGPPDPDPDEEEEFYAELYKNAPPPSQEDTDKGDLMPHYPACITDEDIDNEDTPF